MRRATMFALTMLLALVPALAGNGNGPGGPADGPGDPGGSGLCGGMGVVGALPYEDVSAAEEADLVYMREEEKLARDVYQAFDDMWGLRVFGNIALAEQTHMDAVLTLLQKYEIADPVGDNPPGVFGDAALQGLFDQLIAQGEQSLLDALVVGATIEDLDIYDLAQALDRADNQDIRVVFQNLLKGSRNHLRSFFRLLQLNGTTYEAQYITAAELDAIVNSPHEQGMVDADGQPVSCSGGGRGPNPGRMYRHRMQNQLQGDQTLRPFN